MGREGQGGMKLLIAYDGSDGAKAAVRDLDRSGLPAAARARVVTVGERPASSVGAPSMDPTIARRMNAIVERADIAEALSVAQAEELAREGAAMVSALFTGWQVATDVRLGDAAAMIIESASEWGADLIVVGAQGRSALGRLFMGSVSQSVAIRAERSVLVARHVVDRGSNPVRIIIGIDGSPASNAAVEAIAKRSWRPDTELRVVAVAGTYRSSDTAKRVPTAAAWIDERNRAERDTANAALEHSMRLLSGIGVQSAGHFAEGRVQTILSDHAATTDADCIFVAGHAFSGGLPAGTADVMNALITSAPCSVEIVR